MSINLVKGGNISLQKDGLSLTSIDVGLGWSANTRNGYAFDLDAMALLINAQGRLIDDRHFIFYKNLVSPDGAVQHSGDNRTGDGEGDDEVISIDLTKLAPEVAKVAIVASIYDGETRGQNFGGVRDAYIRLVDKTTGNEEVRFDLSDGVGTETCMIFGEVYRGPNGDWKFRAVEQGYQGGDRQYQGRTQTVNGLVAMLLDHGADVA